MIHTGLVNVQPAEITIHGMHSNPCYAYEMPCLPSILCAPLAGQHEHGEQDPPEARLQGDSKAEVLLLYVGPNCRAFKPDYDKVARFLQSQPSGPSKVHAFRLDCATNVSKCRSSSRQQCLSAVY